MEKQYIYQATAHCHMYEPGFVEADYSIPGRINFSAPPEFGGEQGLWTPEHLLLASLSSCFVASFRAVAGPSKLEFRHLDVNTEGTIEKLEGGFRFTKIILHLGLTITREEDRERAAKLLEKAERICIVSRSLACSVTTDPKITLETPAAV